MEQTAQRWSTLTAPPATQFTRWREVICEAFLALTPESDLRDGFAGTVTQWPLAELSIARIDSQRQRVRRTARDIERVPQHGYCANLQLRGTSLMVQHGRSTVLGPGDLGIVDATEQGAFEFGGDFRQLSLWVPQRLLDDQLSAPVRTATRLATATGPGAAVRHVLTALTKGDLTEGNAARMAVHACAILAIALEERVRDDTAATPMRHDRLHACALADIDEHLGDDDLSAPATARRLGISVRLLYSLFADRDHSYATEVRRRRLEHARRELQDPARAGRRIVDVAVEAGFPNVTSFHRAFRREFGRTPAQVRMTGSGPARP
ncbi:helix-turn-helix domain-containing protein [Actinomadura rupiterrae]|uniref:AraC-like ligand-binding domain-containing protein n=1 Tax=Actinomadura rupiterrae TaxID=559627 RepID=UPI0020A2A4E0|nr:helix-turn-helix domain-containing protein [Actinomadura rupiterrae]MCP2342237.1 AraC-like DNA-binding protein [Actinomadura rupiterrae]